MAGGLMGLMRGGQMPAQNGGGVPMDSDPGTPDPQMILEEFNELMQQAQQQGIPPQQASQQAIMQVAQMFGMPPQEVAQILLQFTQQGASGTPGGMPDGGMGGGLPPAQGPGGQ